jgi:hypothetical protein
MNNTTPDNCIDLDLVDKVIALIPDNTWNVVVPGLVDALIDAMPSDVLIQLTGDINGFDRAKEILMSYYNEPDQTQSIFHRRLIADTFRILGDEATLHLLEAMHLDTYKEQA